MIAENTGIQLQRKKFRRVHGNVLDSDDEEEVGGGIEGAPKAKKLGSGVLRDDSMDSTPQDEDFAHVSRHSFSNVCLLSLNEWVRYMP